ncbi:unnamed protein product [Brassica oleracea]
MKQSILGFRSTSVGLSPAAARWRFGVVTSVDGVNYRKVGVLGLWRSGSVFSSFSIYSSVSGAGASLSVGGFSLQICFSSSPFLWNPMWFSFTAVIPGEQVGGASSLCGLTATHVGRITSEVDPNKCDSGDLVMTSLTARIALWCDMWFVASGSKSPTSGGGLDARVFS